MNKSTHFSGIPIIKQILKFISQFDISRTVEQYDSDRYYKKFKTYDHLVTMLFATMSGVSSLRELSTVFLAFEGHINHLNLKHFPKRSTLSDANKKRTSEVFGAIYSKLFQRYAPFLSDSSNLKPPVKNLKIGDNQNTIEIQIWSALIVQLIMLVIQRKIKRNRAYSNMIGVMRFHLLTYINLFKFLENPHKEWWELTSKPPDIQLKLF